MKSAIATKISGVVFVCVVVVSLTACGTVKHDTTVANPEHVFEACKGDVRQKAVIYDEANARADISYKAGNKAESCQHRRKALAALTRSLKSFETGKCSKFHEVATTYISIKVKNLQSRIAREQKSTAALVKRDCS